MSCEQYSRATNWLVIHDVAEIPSVNLVMDSAIKRKKNSCILRLLRAALVSQVIRGSCSKLPANSIKNPSMKADLYFVRHGETEANRDNVLQGLCDYPLTDKGVQQCEDVGEALRSIRWAKIFSSDLPRTIRTSDILLSKSDEYDSNGDEKLSEQALLREMSYGVLEMLPRGTSFQEAFEIVALREGIRYEDVVDSAETNADVKTRQHKFLTTILFPAMKSIHAPPSAPDSTPLIQPGVSTLDSTMTGNINFIVNSDSERPKILCVSHGGFIRRFFSNFCDLEYVSQAESEKYPGAAILSSVFGIMSTKRLKLENCSISVCTVEWAAGALEGDYVCTASEDNVNIINHLRKE